MISVELNYGFEDALRNPTKITECFGIYGGDIFIRKEGSKKDRRIGLGEFIALSRILTRNGHVPYGFTPKTSRKFISFRKDDNCYTPILREIRKYEIVGIDNRPITLGDLYGR